MRPTRIDERVFRPCGEREMIELDVEPHILRAAPSLCLHRICIYRRCALSRADARRRLTGGKAAGQREHECQIGNPYSHFRSLSSYSTSEERTRRTCSRRRACAQRSSDVDVLALVPMQCVHIDMSLAHCAPNPFRTCTCEENAFLALPSDPICWRVRVAHLRSFKTTPRASCTARYRHISRWPLSASL